MKNFYDDPSYKKTVAELHDELLRLRKELKVPDAPPPAAYGPAPKNISSKPPKETP